MARQIEPQDPTGARPRGHGWLYVHRYSRPVLLAPSIDRTRNGAVDEERTGSAARRVYRAKSAGDTVNTAKRAASGSLPARLHVSADTRKALRDASHFEARGLLEVKSKG